MGLGISPTSSMFQANPSIIECWGAADRAYEGTIKHAQLAAIAHNREVVARYRALAKTSVAYQDSYDFLLETSTREIEALQD